MKLDLDRTPRGRSDLDLAGEVGLDWRDDGPEIVQVQGTLCVDNLEARILVSGQLDASGQVTCSRCLEPFALQWMMDVSFMVLRDVDSEEGRDDSMVVHQHEGLVDLTEILRESVILGYPQATICDPDCRGLCPGCGMNLNLAACTCETENHDPRWDNLP